MFENSANELFEREDPASPFSLLTAIAVIVIVGICGQLPVVEEPDRTRRSW